MQPVGYLYAEHRKSVWNDKCACAVFRFTSTSPPPLPVGIRKAEQTASFLCSAAVSTYNRAAMHAILLKLSLLKVCRKEK